MILKNPALPIECQGETAETGMIERGREAAGTARSKFRADDVRKVYRMKNEAALERLGARCIVF